MAKVFAFVLVLACASFVPLFANAADLTVSSASPSVQVGATFSVDVAVTNVQTPINAVSSVISFPPELLEVTGLSKDGSIISMYVTEPAFSNTAGTVRFEGILLNTDAVNTGGRVLRITFKAKAAGTAKVQFISGSVLANDGAGTNTLSGLGALNMTVRGGEISPPTTPPTLAPSVKTPVVPALVVSSPTHPDQTKWYAHNNPEFVWQLPEGALEVRTAINTQPETVPHVRYVPAISRKQVADLAEGTSYFHVQARTAAGWGETAHFRVNVDTAPPEPFQIRFPQASNIFTTNPTILFQTTDSGSKITHYTVQVGNELAQTVPASEQQDAYTLPTGQTGTYAVSVTAFDEAGNTTQASTDVVVEKGVEQPELPEAGGVRPDTVESPSLFSRIVPFLVWIAGLLFVAGLVIAAIPWVSRLLRRTRKKKSFVGPGIEEIVHKKMVSLRKGVNRRMILLRKEKTNRKRVAEEIRFLEEHKARIEDVEETIKKEMKRKTARAERGTKR